MKYKSKILKIFFGGGFSPFSLSLRTLLNPTSYSPAFKIKIRNLIQTVIPDFLYKL